LRSRIAAAYKPCGPSFIVSGGITTFSVLLLRSTVVIVWPSTLPTYLHHDLWQDWSVGPWKSTIFCSSVMLPSSHAARSPGDAGVGGAA